MTFLLKDTSEVYQIYFIVKHTNLFAYRNLWVLLQICPPDTGKVHRADQKPPCPYDGASQVNPMVASTTAETNKASAYPVSLELADNTKGWLGSGMGNIFEERIFWNTLKPKIPGPYTFSIRQIMYDTTLRGVISIGIRVQKSSFYNRL